MSKSQLRQTASVTFSPRSDLALAVALGAVDGDLELGGLRLTDLDLEAGASRATVRFSQPNAARCRAATLSAGAAELSVLGLGNSRCERIAFEGGVGRVTLDFGGAWTSSSAVTVKMALGEVALRLPREVGRPDHARQVPGHASSPRAWSGEGPAISRPATTRRRGTWTST